MAQIAVLEGYKMPRRHSRRKTSRFCKHYRKGTKARARCLARRRSRRR